MASDGKVIIQTDIDPKGVIEGVKDIEASLLNLDDAMSKSQQKRKSIFSGLLKSLELETKEMDTARKSLFSGVLEALRLPDTGVSEQIEKVQELGEEIKAVSEETRAMEQELSDAEVSPQETSEVQFDEQEYAKINTAIQTIQDDLKDAIEYQNLFVESGGDKNSDIYINAQNSVDRLTASLEELTKKRDEMAKAGGIVPPELASSTQAQVEEVEKLNPAVEKATQKIDKAKTSVKEYSKEVSKAKNSTDGFGKSFGDFGKRIKSAFTNFLKMGLGIASIFTLFNKLRGVIKEGIGDFAKVDDETNKTISNFKNSLAQLKGSFVSAFAPILNYVMPILTAFVEKLNVAVDKIAQFMNALSGKTTYKKAIASTSDYAKSISKATKEQKKYLSGLDEIKTWQSNKDTSADENQFKPSYVETPIDSKILDMAEKFKEALKEAFEIVKKGWDDSFDPSKIASIKENLKSIGDTLKEIFTDAGVQESAQRFGETLLYTIGYVSGNMANVGLSIADLITGGIAQGLEDKKDEIKEKLINIFDINTDNLEIIQDLSDSLAKFFEILDSNDNKKNIGEIFGSLTIAGLTLVEIFSKVTNTILRLQEKFAEMTMPETTGFASSLITAFRGIADVVEGLVDLFGAIFLPIFDFIAEKGEFIAELFAKGVLPIFTSMFNALGGLLSFIGNLASAIADFIHGDFDGAIEHITTGWNNLLDGFKKGWETEKARISNFMTWIKDIFKEKINGVIGIINGLISRVASAINSIASMLSGISFQIPDWLPVIGGRSFKINLPHVPTPQIPYLASGSVIPPNAPFMAMLGDQRHGTNLEAPESLIRKIVREESGNNGNYTFVAQLDGKTIFKEVISQAKLRQMASSQNPFELT